MRQMALIDTRSTLENACKAVLLPLKETQKYTDVDEYFNIPTTEMNVDAASFTRLDANIQAEIESVRSKSSDLLSDLLRMAELGLQSFNEERSANQEQTQKLMTAEARTALQSETISNLNEKLAITESKLSSAQQEAKERTDTVSKLDKEVAELRADKKEKTTMLFDLKDELAKTLEQKRVIDLDRQNITARAEKLESQLGASETIVTQRGLTISDLQVAPTLFFSVPVFVHVYVIVYTTTGEMWVL